MEHKNLILSNRENLLDGYIDEQDFKHSQEILRSYVANKDNYRKNQFKITNGARIQQDYSSRNQRRSYFCDCTFEQAILNHSGFTGSVFLNCDFIDCQMDFCIFDSCIFENCNFSNTISTEILGASFCRSVFRNTTFENCYLHACFFTDASFSYFHFNDCTIIDIIWENAIFRDSTFMNVKLDNLNFEFVQFHNIHFINTTIPFATIPYIFNGLSYLLTTNDDVKIESEDPSNKEGFITKEEYISLIPHLEKFYMHTQNYFPLANILVAQQKYKEAFEIIKRGIPFIVQLREFRILRYFSILLQLNQFDFGQKKEIYNLINNEISHCSLSTDEYRNWSLYISEIRDNLLNQKNKPYLTIELSTNILNGEYEKLTYMVEVMEDILTTDEAETHYIEIRHNSPFDFFISVFSDMENIIKIISTIYMLFAGYDYFYTKFLSHKKARLDNEKAELEIQLLKKNLEESNENSDKQQTNNDYVQRYSETLKDRQIIINRITHNVYNNTNEYIDVSLQHSTINVAQRNA